MGNLFLLILTALLPIRATTNPEGWIVSTGHSAYQLVLSEGRLVPVFYGDASQSAYGEENPLWTGMVGPKPSNWVRPVQEVATRGDLPYHQPLVEAVFPDGVRDLDLLYESGSIVEDGRTLRLVLRDSYYPLEVVEYIRAFPEYDIIEKWMELKNTGRKGSVLLENVMSGGIVLPHDEYTLTRLVGVELNEFQVESMPLATGLTAIESKAFKSNFFGPWFRITTPRTSDSDGPVWFGSVHYSGNWALRFEKRFQSWLQVSGGIHWWDSSLSLAPGECFTTPKMSFGYSPSGTDAATQNQHRYVREAVLPVNFRSQLRPVLYNGWENSYFAISEEGQMALAERAASLGIELFVVDDGWFRGRTASDSGLGNYHAVDTGKFPGGLEPLIDKVHSLGMKFGLWVEPESVSQNAELLQKHPEWTFQYPHRRKDRYRTMLNLANEGAYQYLLDELSTLLETYDIDYIKWDQNTHLTEPGWPSAPKGKEREARIRHTAQVYRLVEELRRRFPAVSFETCASGGGRVDLGMLSLMDEAWVSDNTDPVDRIFIQNGFAMMLPANTMSSWVTGMTRHGAVGLDFRFDVSMSGLLGIGADITRWNAEEMELARGKIALYKTFRDVVQQGDAYRLLSPVEQDRSAVQYVLGGRSVVFCYNLGNYVPGGREGDRGSQVLRLKGLSAEARYRVSTGDREIGVIPGAVLMRSGLTWPLGQAPFSSAIIQLEEESVWK